MRSMRRILDAFTPALVPYFSFEMCIL